MDQFEILLAAAKIKEKNHGDIPTLVHHLANSPSPLTTVVLEKLFAVGPMASLPQRWEDTVPPEQDTRSLIPPWLNKLCSGWDEKGDFADICIQEAVSQPQEKRIQLLTRLAYFQGLKQTFLSRLKRYGLHELENLYLSISKSVLDAQYPKQLTIAPTLDCQLSCDYCISSWANPKTVREISFHKILEVLDWAQQSRLTRIGLTGGEPTRYSEFSRLLTEFNERNIEFFIATNGLSPLSITEKIEKAGPLCVTMHLTPQTLKSDSLTQIYQKNATYLTGHGVYVAMRCNFGASADEIRPYMDTAKRTGIREIRAALPIPNAARNNDYVDLNHIKNFVGVLTAFVTEGKRLGLMTKLAKPFFLCELPENIAYTFLSNGSMSSNCPVHMNGFSNNLIVYPDCSFSPCLGINFESQESILQFKDINHAVEHFGNPLKTLMRSPIFEKCISCPLWRGGRCLGVCLSYRKPSDSNKCLEAEPVACSG